MTQLRVRQRRRRQNNAACTEQQSKREGADTALDKDVDWHTSSAAILYIFVSDTLLRRFKCANCWTGFFFNPAMSLFMLIIWISDIRYLHLQQLRYLLCTCWLLQRDQSTALCSCRHLMYLSLPSYRWWVIIKILFVAGKKENKWLTRLMINANLQQIWTCAFSIYAMK